MPMVSEKGQVTIPKEYREKFGIRSGDEVEFEEKDGKLIVKKQKTSFDDYEGYLGDVDVDEKMKELRGRR